MENRFAERLKALRDEKAASQYEVGKAIGKVPATISAYEVGKIQPGLDDLIKLAIFFDVSTDYLLGISSFRRQKDREIIHRVSGDVPELLVLYETLTSIIDTIISLHDSNSEILSILESREYPYGHDIEYLNDDNLYLRNIFLDLDVFFLGAILQLLFMPEKKISFVRELLEKYNFDINNKEYRMEYEKLINQYLKSPYEILRKYVDDCHREAFAIPERIVLKEMIQNGRTGNDN